MQAGHPLDDSPLPNRPIWDITVTERDAQLLADVRGASAMATPRNIVSRQPSMVTSPGLSCADTAAAYYLPRFQRGPTETQNLNNDCSCG